jgi:DNA modification methylase
MGDETTVTDRTQENAAQEQPLTLNPNILLGDVRESLKSIPDNSVHCVVTSPPYWGLRDYGTGKWEGGSPECSHKRDSKHSDKTSTGQRNLEGAIGDGIYKTVCQRCGAIRVDNQLGLEPTFDAYVQDMVEVFREVRRVLRDDGTLWLNLGDSYAGSNGNGWKQTIASTNASNAGGDNEDFRARIGRDDGYLKPKDLVGIPWRVALALQQDGWFLRQDIIWHKPNPMPESVTDRCTKAHEYIFLLTKKGHYFFDSEAIKEPAKYAFDNRGARADSRKEAGISNAMHGSTGAFKNKRSVWTVNTKPFKEAHFAVFPTDLVEPCIKAGTSEKGCCSKCGTPIVRVVDRKRIRRNELPEDDPRYRPNTYEGEYESINGKGDAGFTETQTIGWDKACECVDSETVPCTVLDTFFGSGTTGVVSLRLGRNYLGCELNPEYAKIATKRLADEEEKIRKEKETEQLSLFQQ